ncbi:MAG: 23S rRNA (adenine(2503)-C(2))-methyltransferase RlmN [Anaerolineales bacterium]
MPPLIYNLEKDQLETLLAELGQPAYRARQVWEGLYKHLYNTPEQFSNLPKQLREKLGKELSFQALTPVTTLESSDKQTVKTLFKLGDGKLIEAVLMKYGDPADTSVERSDESNEERSRGISTAANASVRRSKKRRTLCISSQAGCAMGCVFCATGQMGFKRHLTSGEIVAQVLYYARQLAAQGEKVTNVVLMGMGEPFHNYENVMAAIDRLNDPEGFAFGARRFTISTVGLIPAIRRFADEKRQVNLAISLHESDDESRSAIMPVNKKHNINKLLEACRYYVEQTGRRVTFEWALIDSVNDSQETARKLALRLKGLLCHVNAIPLNPTTGYQGRATDRQRAQAFKETLEQAGIPCTIRMRRGIDIQAGCGQLAGAELDAGSLFV